MTMAEVQKISMSMRREMEHTGTHSKRDVLRTSEEAYSVRIWVILVTVYGTKSRSQVHNILGELVRGKSYVLTKLVLTRSVDN